MDKREIAAKITQKKEEIKNLISQDKFCLLYTSDAADE